MSRSHAQRFISDQAPLLAILLFVLLTRILSMEQMISGYDPGNYWLALDDYSIAHERPHPPGYPVYVGVLHVLAAVTGDRHSAMLTAQLLFSLAAVVSIYLLAKQWLDVRGAILASALLAINPLFWLYGSTSENYAWDVFFGATLVLGLLGARRWWGWLGVGLLLGVAAGYRGASVVLMAPAILYLLVVRWRGEGFTIREPGLIIAGAVSGLLVWLPITAVKVGGISELMREATGVTTASAGPFLGNIVGMAITLFWTLNLMGLYLVLRSKPIIKRLMSLHFRFDRLLVPVLLLLWVLPQLAFFALVIYAKGYALLPLPAICIATAWLVSKERTQGMRGAVAAVLLLAHSLVFLAVPYSSPPAFTSLAPRNRTTVERLQSAMGRGVSIYLPSVWRIRASDAQVAEALAMIRSAIGSGDDTTSIVLDPSVGLFAGPRIMQVYLPRATFLSPGIRSVRLIASHRGIDKVERYGDTASLAAPRLLLLSDRGLAGRYGDLEAWPIARGEFYALLEIAPAAHESLRTRLEELFVRWE